MIRLTRLAAPLAGAALLALAPAAHAQWSASTVNPLRIGENSSDIPMVLPAPDGGAYVAWQQTGGGFYNNIHVQHLSPSGQELWGHGGITAVPGTSSATFFGDFEITVAADGNLILVNSIVSSDSAAPTTRQAAVQKFNATTGAKMWGSGGADVVVTSGTAGGWPAHVAALPDGGCVVAYTVNNQVSGSTVNAVRLRRVDASGALVGAGPITILQQNTKFVPVSVVHVGGGSYVVLWQVVMGLNQAGLRLQKFDSSGAIAPGWGAANTGLTLDASGITPRDFPQLQPDASGGVVIFWRTYANAGFGACADAALQHVLSDGTFKFPGNVVSVDHNVVPCGGGGGVGQYTASGAFTRDTTTGAYSYFVAAAQGPSASGTVKSVIAQKFDDAGNRLWGPGGFTVVPQSSNSQVGPNHVNLLATSDGGAMVFGDMGRGFTTINGVVFAARISPGGASFVWNKYLDTDVTTGKGRMAATHPNSSDDAIVVWTRSGSTMYAGRVTAATGDPAVTGVPANIDVDLPSTITVCPGDTVQLSVQVSGTPGIAYQWQRHYAFNVAGNPDAFWNLNNGDSSFQCTVPADGTTYSGVNSPTLTITNIQRNDPTATCPNSDPNLNQYRVVVFNAASDGFENPAATYSTTVTVQFSDICTSTGVCCRGSTCALTAQGACTAGGQAGALFSAGSACNPSGSNTQPCCKADYNKQGGVELLDIFAFLNDWFGNVQWADFNANGSVDLLDIFAFLTAWFAGGC
jgi:hypothetical protein